MAEEMNLLAAQQEELGKKIMQLHASCKKDSQSRKTEKYIEQKLETLEELWDTVQKNDDELNTFKVPNHVYFTKKYIQQLKEQYGACKKYLETIRDELQKTPQLLLLKKQNLKCEELDRTIDQINLDLTEEKSKLRYELQQKKLVRQWEAIQELHEEIMIHEEAFTSAYFKYDKFHNYQKKFEDILEKLTKETFEAQSSCQQQLPVRHISSPQITIPTFHGGYENWGSFHDVFLRVVHDNLQFSKAEKIQLLKTHVRGEAARLIQHLTTTENNYETAWDLLQNRYENKRLLASKLIDKLLDLPNFSNGNIEKLKLLHDVTKECTRGLENIGISTKSWGPIIIRIISRKWDSETNKMYEQTITEPHKIQEYQKFMEFLERRFQSLEATTFQKRSLEATSPSRRNNSTCQYCKKDYHAIYHCQTFRRLSVEERNRFVQKTNLCSNCLNHEKHSTCHSSATCNICRKHHHTILHNDNFQRNFSNSGNQTSRRADQRDSNQNENIQTRNNPRRNYQRQNQNTSNYHVKDPEENVLLATALVEVATASTTQYLRVLIDQGSQSAFITEAAAQRLNLPRQKIRAEISGIGDGRPQLCSSAVDLRIKPRFPSNFSLEVKMLVLPKLTQSTPRYQLEGNTSYGNEILADPTYMKPGPIDAIVGAREYTHIILNGIQKTKEGLLKQNTELGWMVSGGVSSSHFPLQVTSMISRHEEDSQLTKFWELEELPNTHKYISEDDEVCEKFYDETTYRNEEGRFIVRIPFKECNQVLGQSKPRAAARLRCLENRFLREPHLKEQYDAFMDEYLKLGHMEKVSPQHLHEGRYYIPHQAVFKMDSTTTKLRVVFDASSKSTTNVSLNDLMLTGPRLQQNLSEILLRWRKHKVVFTADIEKMYRQIQIHPEDKPYQRILWRSDSQHRMTEYELTTITYGTASAPYLAVKTLQALAKSEETKYPIASKITLRDFYVDDVLSGANDLEAAIEIQQQLLNMMKSAGFNLRKWTSNNTDLLRALPKSQQDQTVQELAEDDIQKSLGVFWSPYDDNFIFKVTTSSDSLITKRQILSEISKIFDPLGWLSPIVIKSKVLIQDLWLKRLGWDEKIDGELADRWLTFKRNINKVQDIKIPRWMRVGERSQIQIHGFCDASEKAYGAVVYSRTITTEDEIAVTLLWAKSKVAPVKLRTTLPRLELCAAHLLAKMINQTISTLEIQNIETFAWSDSMITLGWIKGQPTRWKTFVANRVCDINRYLDSRHWNHVRTSENPADVISRGSNPEKLANNLLWWNGPAWLHSHEPLPVTKEIPETDQETKKIIKCFQAQVKFTENLIERFSDLTRMIRTLSYCRRVIHRSNSPTLSIEETRKTLKRIIKIVQNVEFSSEILSINTTKTVGKSSKIYTLNPFMDGEQVLRVGGRLQNSELTYSQKHPIILSSQNHLSKLIIMDAHNKTLHGGNQATLAYLRRKYWIINGKKRVRSILSKCITCIRYKAKTSEQQMGQLPATRVTPSPPFINSGVDYAGPIKVRATKGRGHKSYKGYISVFVCLSTKALHLEVVSDMTTDSFLAAFQRFTARRGHCENIYSDNGTNFVGAAHYFEEQVLKLTQQESLQKAMVNHGTNWHFIPPAAPHFGGLWEAGVKSMKHHLKRVIGETTLTYEELTTLLHQIEASLNSRPLWPLSDEIDDYFVLTPGHFLIGREILSPIDPIASNINSSLSEKWRLIQKMKKDFWKVWSTEYLGRLQQRYKWQDQGTNLKKGTMVIIKENTINPSQWPLARITDVHPGRDGVVRVVTLRKADRATLKRPIHTLIPLPVEEIENETPNDQTQVTANIAVISSTHNTTKSQDSKQKRNDKPKPTVSHLQSIQLLLLWLSLMLLPKCQSSYVIKYPQGGIFIEHFGIAQINRGTFRMEVNYNRTKIKEDIQNVSNVVTNFEMLCNQTRKLSELTHCEILDHHLKEQQQHLSWIFRTLHEIQIRPKRGLLGKFLTSVFGVNDEVYEDIDNINKNQEMLIKASNHQTKFMISALSKFNTTKEKINNQLHIFQTRLNQGLEAIQSMNRWFSSIDTNSLNIHVLSSYQIATNYIAEISLYYENIINIQFNRGTIYDIISPTYLHTLIMDINRKLPNNLKALSAPVMEMSVRQNNSHFQIFGYFPIIDISQFDVIKATSIPVLMTNNTYWILATSNDYFAIDYNSQLYFQLHKEEFEQCLKVKHHFFLCAPDVIRNIDNDGNCIIDEIYHKTGAQKCKTFKNSVQATIWKQMATPNTWLFITNGTANIAIICGGVREDVAINATGILSMDPDCIIKTKQLTLTAKRVEHSSLASYSKAVALDRHEEPTHIQHPQFQSASESVIGYSDDLNSLMTEERSIQIELQNHIWQNIRHHYSIVAVTSTTATIVIFLGAWIGMKHLKRRTKGKATDTSEEFELQSLQSTN